MVGWIDRGVHRVFSDTILLEDLIQLLQFLIKEGRRTAEHKQSEI